MVRPVSQYAHLQERYMSLLDRLRSLLDLTAEEVQDLFGSLEGAAAIARRFEAAFSDQTIKSLFADVAALSEEYCRSLHGEGAKS